MPTDRELETYNETDRETLVFGRQIRWEDETHGQYAAISPHGPTDVDELSTETVAALFEAGHLDPKSRQNNSPTAEMLYEAGNVYECEDGVTVGYRGYMIGPERADERITIDEINVSSDTAIPDPIIMHFEGAFDTADTLHTSDEYLSAWWD